MQKRVETPQNLASIVQGLRSQGKVIVLALGAFEMLRPTDVKYLEDAQTRGDYLIVGVGTKWPGGKGGKNTVSRNSAKDRATVLAGLRCVTYSTTFDQDNADQLIQILKPSVVAYSENWTERSAPERKTLQEMNIPMIFCGDSKPAPAGSSKKLVGSRKGS